MGLLYFTCDLLIESETCCHLVALNKINIHNTSVLTCESLLLTCIALFYSWGVKVMYLENATIQGPTIHLPDDGRINNWICRIGEATNYGENLLTQTKIRLRATSYVTNTAWDPLGSNCVLRSEKPPTNLLNYSRVLDFKFYPLYVPQNQSIYKAATSQAQRKNPIVISSKGLEPNQNKIGSV